MKTILLFRHGKSSWDVPRIAAGSRAPARPARREGGPVHGAVPRTGRGRPPITSSARRPSARSRRCGTPPTPGAGGLRPPSCPELYGASPDDVLACVRAVDPGVDTVLVVGHEPACSADRVDPDRRRGPPVPDRRARVHPVGRGGRGTRSDPASASCSGSSSPECWPGSTRSVRGLSAGRHAPRRRAPRTGPTGALLRNPSASQNGAARPGAFEACRTVDTDLGGVGRLVGPDQRAAPARRLRKLARLDP